MQRIILALTVFAGLLAPMRARAADYDAANSIRSVSMDILSASVVSSRNLGLIYASIYNQSDWALYPGSTGGKVFLGIDLSSPAGSQLYNDMQRAMRTGARLSVRCVEGTTHNLIIKKGDGSARELFQYWIPELVTFPD